MPAQVLEEQLRQHSVIVYEGPEALGDLSVIRVEVLGENRGDRLLLLLDVNPELPVKVVEQRGADVRKPGLPSLSLCVPKRSKPDHSHIEREPLGLWPNIMTLSGRRSETSTTTVSAEMVHRRDYVWDPDRPWLQNAHTEHTRAPFHAILARANSVDHPSTLTADGLAMLHCCGRFHAGSRSGDPLVIWLQQSSR